MGAHTPLSEHARLCPICGQRLLVDDGSPKVDLASNTICLDGQTAQVTPFAAEVMYMLARRWPDVVPTEVIMCGIYGSRGGSEASVQTQISKLRSVLKPLGWTIRNVYKRGYGLERIDG